MPGSVSKRVRNVEAVVEDKTIILVQQMKRTQQIQSFLLPVHSSSSGTKRRISTKGNMDLFPSRGKRRARAEERRVVKAKEAESERETAATKGMVRQSQ